MDKSLNDKQKRFVQEYLLDLNATQAAIRAGYSARAAHSTGHRMLRNAEISAAIQAAMQQRAQRLAITADQVLENLENARKQAMEEKQSSAAIRACELTGRHIGMFSTRPQEDEKDSLMTQYLKRIMGSTIEPKPYHDEHDG